MQVTIPEMYVPPTITNQGETGPESSRLDVVLSALAADHLLLPETNISWPINRLLVLIPDEEVNEPLLAHHLCHLAGPHKLEVTLLGTIWRGDAAYARRRLSTLAAPIRQGGIYVSIVLKPYQSWLQAVAQTWRPGDLIVCHTKQKFSTFGLKRQSLADKLLATYHAPVYVLNGFYARLPLELPTLWGRLASILVPLLIIVGFFVLQHLITLHFTGFFYYALMILSVLVEIGLIAGWEGVFELF